MRRQTNTLIKLFIKQEVQLRYNWCNNVSNNAVTHDVVTESIHHKSSRYGHT